MGLEKSQFPELDGMGYDEDQELTDQELEAKREEKEENDGEWNLSPNTNSETSEEWSEEAIIKGGD
jgi:hypothetical protein